MGEMRRISVDLNRSETNLIDRLLAERRFSGEDEVLHYALRLLQDWIVEQDEGDRIFAANYTPEEIRRLWDEGLASGPSTGGNFDPEEIRQRGLAKLAEMRDAEARAA